jgi:hypothetical protein
MLAVPLLPSTIIPAKAAAGFAQLDCFDEVRKWPRRPQGRGWEFGVRGEYGAAPGLDPVPAICGCSTKQSKARYELSFVTTAKEAV